VFYGQGLTANRLLENEAKTKPLTIAAGPALSRRRKMFFAGVICACAGLVVFLLGEVYIRHFSAIDEAGWHEIADDPILFYRIRAGAAGDDHGHRRTHTAQHIRGPRIFARSPADGAKRVLWIGNSACFGSGCDDEQTAPFQFQDIAADRGVIVESINLAVVGYNVRQVREVLAQRSAEFAGAKTVIYYHHENDIVNAPWAQLAPRLPAGLFWEYDPPQPFVKKLIKRSAVVRRLWNTDVLVRLRGDGDRGIDAPAVRAALADRSAILPIHGFTRKCVELYDEQNEYGLRFRDELYRMADLADAAGASFMMVYWPSRTLLHHAELGRLRRTLSGWCRARGIALVDVTDAFLGSAAADVYSDTIHPGPAGQRIVAEAVFQAWRSEGGQ